MLCISESLSHKTGILMSRAFLKPVRDSESATFFLHVIIYIIYIYNIYIYNIYIYIFVYLFIYTASPNSPGITWNPLEPSEFIWAETFQLLGERSDGLAGPREVPHMALHPAISAHSALQTKSMASHIQKHKRQLKQELRGSSSKIARRLKST